MSRVIGDSDRPQGRQGRPTEPDSGRPHTDDTTDALSAEAARLAEAFAGWVAQRSPTDGREPGPPDQTPHRGSPGSAGSEPAADPADSIPGDGAHDQSATTSDTAVNTSPVCGCGRATGVDVICRMCPICRAAEFLQAVRPEVLERCADVLAMVAGSLHAIAADRAGQPPSPSTSAPQPGSADPDSDTSAEPTRPSRSSPGAEPGVPIPVRGDDEDPHDGADEQED